MVIDKLFNIISCKRVGFQILFRAHYILRKASATPALRVQAVKDQGYDLATQRILYIENILN